MADPTPPPTLDDKNAAFDQAAKQFIVALFSPLDARDSAWSGVTACLRLYDINGDTPGLDRAIEKLRAMSATPQSK